MSVTISDVSSGLAPYHYAGFVNKPDVGALSAQPQRILIIGAMEKGNAPQGVVEVDPDKIDEQFTDGSEPTTISSMLHAAYNANSYMPLYALAVGEGQNLIDLLKEMPEEQYTQIACSFADNFLTDIDTEMDKRWGSVRQIDGHFFVSIKGTKQELEASLGGQENLKHINIISSYDSTSPAHVWAAVLAATVAKYAHKPYLPYHSIPLEGVDPPTNEPRLEERNQLLEQGISTFRVEGKKVVIDRLVNFWTKDKSYQDLNKKMILSYLRYDFVQFLKQMYPRHALSNDESQADGDVATPKSARDLAIARHLRWKKEKYVQDPGEEFKKLVEVKINENDGETMEFYLPVKLMGQYRRSEVTIAFTP